ncbi:ammonium transporter [Acetobacterium sp. KB-1]|jgi:Amt family ammonium transporter|uniref:ammonium transporter n=1 Tax=Acetobacterium TaxID=33951 RepID=UPI000DBEBE4D|nr:ammonium transporter [Acetobacterium sp. KB-1]AWW27799.1 ammonia permease [Acetobacterium sp. KB-1]
MINSGDVAFVLISSMLVFFMTPGLGLFYAGMVRRKNVINTLMSVVFCCGLATVMWFAVGYSISFGTDVGGLGVVGNLSNAFFNGVSATEAGPYAANIPGALFAIFQLMFCIITPAILVGALSGRMRFSAMFIFITVWLLLVYYPLAHMVWGTGGFIAGLGAVDFAGGNVIHISSGVSGLIACIILGTRKGYGIQSYHPHNIPMFFTGGAILWVGWFAFNGGSALAANGLAVQAVVNSMISSAAAMLSWMTIETVLYKKVTVMGAVTGAIIGLVAITPGAGFVAFSAALVIGALVSPICFFFMTKVKHKFGYDDALDAFGCHGIGGIWGGIATGLFAQSAINPIAQWDGLFFGATELLVAQLTAVGISIIYSAVMTAVIMTVLKKVMKIRVTPEAEALGLDISEHSEQGYPAFSGIDQ